MPCILMMMTMSMIISMMFMIFKHPVSMMIMIMMQTMLVCMMCGLLSNLWWFSYLLFMVMIGGLLVLFMYMTNVASNEKFNTKKMNYFFYLMIICMIFFTIMENDLTPLMNTSSWFNFSKINMKYIIMKYYNYPSNNILFMMMIYLLITMIMSVKITDLSKGALRQKY
uniref:NADH-ubiquinone oxidoreductase chain 6 n=1 Tax=Cassida sp. EMHAU-15090501 TaxID=2480058 RepID=A0A3G3C774_9CUCU|nr:NADH dehydrogenase subunit 6 [Cassida sp. EMHAU-15090501]